MTPAVGMMSVGRSVGPTIAVIVTFPSSLPIRAKGMMKRTESASIVMRTAPALPEVDETVDVGLAPVVKNSLASTPWAALLP